MWCFKGCQKGALYLIFACLWCHIQTHVWTWILQNLICSISPKRVVTFAHKHNFSNPWKKNHLKNGVIILCNSRFFYFYFFSVCFCKLCSYGYVLKVNTVCNPQWNFIQYNIFNCLQTFLYLCCAVLCMTASRPVCYWQVQHMLIWRKLISLSIQEISRRQVGQFCSQDLLVCYLEKKIIIFGLQIFLCSCWHLSL